MATPVGPFTMEQWWETENDPWVRAYLAAYIKAGSVVSRLPMTTYPDLRRKSKRLRVTPSVNSRKVNAEPAYPFVQPVEDYEETCYLYADNFQYDEVFKNTENAVESDITAMPTQQYMEAIAFAMNNDFIANDHVTGDPDRVVGLKYRLQNPTVFGNRALAMQAQADLSTGGLLSGGAGTLEFDFQMICNHMGRETGRGILCLGSPQALAAIDRQIKAGGGSGGFSITKDSFDRSLSMWKDMEIASVGYAAPASDGSQNVPIILDNQDANGYWPQDAGYNPAAVNPNNNATGAKFTTLYFMFKDDGNRFGLWQRSKPQIRDMYIPGTRHYVVMFDHSLGIWCNDPLSIACLYGLRVDGPTYS